MNVFVRFLRRLRFRRTLKIDESTNVIDGMVKAQRLYKELCKQAHPDRNPNNEEVARDIMKILYDNKIISIILGYIGCVIVAAFVVLAEKKKIKNTFKGIFTLCLFVLTWIPINIVCLIKRDYVWEPIKHHRNVEIENIIETDFE